MGNSSIETRYLDPETGVESSRNPKAIQLTYTDASGRRRIGYSIDNRMYEDEAGRRRIENGSIVTNAAGTQTWVMTPKGGVEYSAWREQQQPARSDAQNRLQQAQSAAMQAAQTRTALEVEQLEAQRPDIRRQYDALARENYLGYQNSREALANSLASQGLYNSGYSDSAQIAQQNGYRTRSFENEQERLRALATLEQQISAARQNGTAELSELEASYLLRLQEQANADREYEEKQRQNARAAQQYADQRSDVAFEQRLKLRNAKSAEEQQAIENAYAAAKYGDFKPLRSLGIDTTAAERAYAGETQKLYQTVYGRQTETTAEGMDPVQYEEIAGLALSFAENQKNAPRQEVLNQLSGFESYLTRQYGEEGYRLYRDLILKQMPWSQTYEAPPAQTYAYHFDDLYSRFYGQLYRKDSSGKTVHNAAQDDNVRGSIAAMLRNGQLSAEDGEALCRALGLEPVQPSNP